MGDVLGRIATFMAPLAKEHGFVRKGRFFRREDDSRTVAFLAIRSASGTDRALTSFRVFGSLSPVEWTAWSHQGDGDPSLVRSPNDGVEMWPLVPSFEFWDWEVTGRFTGYPYGAPARDSSRGDGTWTLVTGEESLVAYGEEVARQLQAQDYVATLVRLMDRDHLRHSLSTKEGLAVFMGARGLHYMVEASAEPEAVDSLLASAAPQLPARLESFIRTTLPALWGRSAGPPAVSGEATPPPDPEPTLGPGRVPRASWDPPRTDSRLLVSTIQLSTGETAPVLVEQHDGAGVTIQLNDEVGREMTQGVPLGTWFRRLGLGRVRADLSVPLEPPDDRVWITEPDGDARLHFASRDGVAVVTLGELSYSSRRMLQYFGLGVIICVGGHLLPDEHHRQLIHERDQGTVWGGLVSEGPAH